MSIEELAILMKSIWPVWMMALFAGIVIWAYLPGRKRKLEEYALIPLRDDPDED